jgi:hypothetical protein
MKSGKLHFQFEKDEKQGKAGRVKRSVPVHQTEFRRTAVQKMAATGTEAGKVHGIFRLEPDKKGGLFSFYG